MKIPSAPQKVTLNITNKCNLECLHCGVSGTKNMPGDLSLNEWKEVVDELARIKVFQLLISGGEPFMRADFYEIFSHILKYHFRISINTNGTLFDDETISQVCRSGRLDQIQVSLDGPDSDTHDSIRGKGSFERTMRGVETLCRWKAPFSFFVVVSRNNKDSLQEIVRISERLGASQVSFSPLLPQGSALSHVHDLFLLFDERKEVEAELKELKKRYPRLIGGSLIKTIERMQEVSRIDLPDQKSTKAHKITSCGGSVSECSIRPDGWVIPCDRLWGYRVGNIREQAFESIWLYSRGFKRFRERYTRRMDSFLECRDCVYTFLCRGGCPAIPYNMGRGIEGWDPMSCYRVFTGEKESYV
ncbi:MAG: radical SAM protein [Deltaproteobacteria bacterium]|nr:radical SAM protein [Deltaproteobacteria bacterium]